MGWGKIQLCMAAGMAMVRQHRQQGTGMVAGKVRRVGVGTG